MIIFLRAFLVYKASEACAVYSRSQMNMKNLIRNLILRTINAKYLGSFVDFLIACCLEGRLLRIFEIMLSSKDGITMLTDRPVHSVFDGTPSRRTYRQYH